MKLFVRYASLLSRAVSRAQGASCLPLSRIPLGCTISGSGGAAVADGLVLVYWNDRQHPLSTEVNIILFKAVFLRDCILSSTQNIKKNLFI